MRSLIYLVVIAVAAHCAVPASVWALSCAAEPHVPVYLFQNRTHFGDVILTTNPTVGETAGANDGMTAFSGAMPAGTTCPTGSALLLKLRNVKDGRHFYTASTAVHDAKIANAKGTDPGWKDDGHLAACIANTEDGTDEDKNSQECDVPLFRHERAPPTASSIYTTAIQMQFNCEQDATCVGSMIGRAYPPPIGYAVRTYSETYSPLTSGTQIKKQVDGDDEATILHLPFAFNFYGVAYTQVKFTTNGLLTFNPASADAEDESPMNKAIPDPTPPNNFVAGWWNDSIMSDQTGFVYKTIGTAPNRTFIVQWGAGTWANRAELRAVHDMQIHLIEGDNRIEVHYGPYQLKGIFVPPTENASAGIEAPLAMLESKVGLGCTPTCAATDWPENQVVAYMAKPGGYLVTETHPDQTDPKQAYTPLAVDGKCVSVATNADEGSVSLNLGFPFEYDGQKFTTATVSTTGALRLGSGAIPSDFVGAQPGPDIPPAAGDVARSTNVIAAWWDRMLINTADGVRNPRLMVAQCGTAPNRYFTIEWQSLTHLPISMPPAPIISDPTERNVQVTLRESTNNIEFYYGDTINFVPGGRSFDTASAGLINAVGDGTGATYRLLWCTPNCMEGRRETTGVQMDGTMPIPKLGGWPRFTKFVFTQDTLPQVTWHEVYRQYFMPDDFAPTGFQSKGHCGNCHDDPVGHPGITLHHPEQKLYSALLDPNFYFPGVPSGKDRCTSTPMGGTVWIYPMLSMVGARIDPASRLVNPGVNPGGAQTPITWLSEPPGGFNRTTEELHMPWDVFCDPARGNEVYGSPFDINDEAKSRIRRWILNNTP